MKSKFQQRFEETYNKHFTKAPKQKNPDRILSYEFRKIVEKILEIELRLEGSLLDYTPEEQKQARKELKELFQGARDLDGLIEVMEELGYDQKAILSRVIRALTM